MVKKYICILRSFIVTNVCNYENNLCSPCSSMVFLAQMLSLVFHGVASFTWEMLCYVVGSGG